MGLGEVGVGLGEVGVGLGEDVPEAGSTWQVVSVFALALVEVPGLKAAAPGLSTPACAVPASAPRVRKHPPTTLSAVTRTCARRMRIACLRCSSGLMSALRGFGGD